MSNYPDQRRNRHVQLAHNWHLIVAILLALFALGWTLYWPRLGYDDAYITYRYAHNIALGRGFVYNPGEHVLGTTTPLYTLLLAALSLIWPDIPSLSIVLSGLSWGAAVLLLYAIGRKAHNAWVGLLAAAFLALDALINNAISMETCFYIALGLLALYLHMREHPHWSAFIAALAFLTRWDGILIISALLLAEFIRTRRLPWSMAVVWAVIAAPWLLFSQLYFGSIFPNSFFAKMGQVSSGLVGGGAESFGRVLLNLLQERVRLNPVAWLYAPLGLIGLSLRWPKPPAWWPLWLWTMLYLGGYIALGVIGFHWYYPPLVPAVALAISQGVVRVAEILADRARRPALGVALVSGLGLLCLWPQVQTLWMNRFAPDAHVESYRQVSDWFLKNSPRNSSIGTLEIGVIGYQTGYPIVDMMGLVSPAMLGHLGDWDQVHHYSIARHWPDYAVAIQGSVWLRSQGWFHDIYSPVGTIENPLDPFAPVEIYRRRLDFPPPTICSRGHKTLPSTSFLCLKPFRYSPHSLIRNFLFG